MEYLGNGKWKALHKKKNAYGIQLKQYCNENSVLFILTNEKEWK